MWIITVTVTPSWAVVVYQKSPRGRRQTMAALPGNYNLICIENVSDLAVINAPRRGGKREGNGRTAQIAQCINYLDIVHSPRMIRGGTPENKSPVR